MRLHNPDVNYLRAIIDFSDQAIFVAPNVKYCARANRIGVRKICPVSARLFQLAWLVIFHQSSRGYRASGCFSQNSCKGFLLMMCNLMSPHFLILSN
jgi:hypothetical protein